MVRNAISRLLREFSPKTRGSFVKSAEHARGTHCKHGKTLSDSFGAADSIRRSVNVRSLGDSFPM